MENVEFVLLWNTIFWLWYFFKTYIKYEKRYTRVQSRGLSKLNKKILYWMSLIKQWQQYPIRYTFPYIKRIIPIFLVGHFIFIFYP